MRMRVIATALMWTFYALAKNPELVASAYETLAAEGHVEQARLRINPELSVELENFAGTGVARGAKALEPR